MASPIQISSLIVGQLSVGEKRLLSLVVAIRHELGGSVKVKGDLSEIVKSSLRKLIASKAVADTDGMYSLSHPK